MHIPVMVAEVLEYLAVRPDGVYIDATAGLGGHTLEIARRLTTGVVIANDRDPDSLEMARRNTAEWSKRPSPRFRKTDGDCRDSAPVRSSELVKACPLAENRSLRPSLLKS